MSLEFVTIGQRARPDDQPEVRTPEETPRQPIDIKPVSAKVKGQLNEPRWGTDKLEHKLGESEKSDDRKSFFRRILRLAEASRKIGHGVRWIGVTWFPGTGACPVQSTLEMRISTFGLNHRKRASSHRSWCSRSGGNLVITEGTCVPVHGRVAFYRDSRVRFSRLGNCKTNCHGVKKR